MLKPGQLEVPRLLNSFDTGATAKMTTAFTHCLTLRITPEMDELVANAAYDAHQTKASWMRGAIHQRLGRGKRTSTDTAWKRRKLTRQNTEE
jgi:hypothetical protein